MLIFFITAIILIFYFKFSKKVPILMYHRIATVKGDRNALPPEKFEQQLQYLKSNGYTTINMNQLYDHYANGTPLPNKPIVLSFDDGYADNLQTAMPLLKKYEFIGNVFVITEWIGRENKWENFGKAPTMTMTVDELKQWQQAGNYIGSHTCSHPFLNKLSSDKLHDELVKSKNSLEDLTLSEVKCICYPYGNFNDNVLEAVKKSNYKIGLAIFNNAPIWNFNLLALPRVVIPSGQRMWEFKLKVSKVHIIFIMLRKLERNVKTLFK